MRKIYTLFLLLVFLTACQRPMETAQEPAQTSSTDASSESSESEEPVAEESLSTPEEESSMEESSVEGSSEPESSEEEPVVETLDLDTRTEWAGKRYSDISTDPAVFDADVESLTTLLPEEALACPDPLEGYLLPMEYTLVYDDAPMLEQILQQSLAKLEEMVSSSDTTMSLHEVLTRASIVQIEAMRGGESETAFPEVMPHIASVIENRLNDGTPLQMDVTYRYAQFLQEAKGLSEEEALAYDTYEAAALPPGPICMPSIEAVQAVLTPEESDDFFFVYDADGKYYFAADYDEHLANCEKAGIY